MKEKCTYCGNVLTDFKIEVRIKINSSRITGVGTWEEIPNASLDVTEILCKKCFDKFSQALANLGENNVHRSKHDSAKSDKGLQFPV